MLSLFLEIINYAPKSTALFVWLTDCLTGITIPALATEFLGEILMLLNHRKGAADAALGLRSPEF